MAFSLFSRSDVKTGIIVPVAANKNWGPGNYIASTDTNNSSIWDITGTLPVGSTANKKTRGILQRLAADTGGHWKGALLRFSWAKPDTGNDDYLEGDTLGSYTAGMARVQAYLDQMINYPGRRLIIFIQIKTSGSDYHAVPLYMRNSATYADGDNYYQYKNTGGAGNVLQQGTLNGEYAYESSNGGPGGYVPNMHVAAVRARFEALMTAFATNFNSNPYLEAICFSEASIAAPLGATGAASQSIAPNIVITRPVTNGSTWPKNDAWFTQMQTGFATARTALSNVQVAQWINADRVDMKTFVPIIRASGVGLGMPDLCPEEYGFNLRNDYVGQSGTAPGNIQHCQDSAGLSIIMGHASKPALSGTVVGRNQVTRSEQTGAPAHTYPTYPGLGTSRQAVHDFAVNTVGVTHLCWAHNTGSQPVTGSSDPQAPASADTYTAYTGYSNVGFNVVTDDWITNGASTITTVETRPTGWT